MTISPWRSRRFPLDALLADAAAFAATLPGDHPLVVESNARGRVWADPERIGQVLRNLLSNAAKHSPPDAPVKLRTTQTGAGGVRVEVADRGSGVHPDDVDVVFEKFGRGRDRSGQKTVGVGLGLYLSRRIVQAHGKELTLGSEPGRGAVFAFELEAVER